MYDRSESTDYPSCALSQRSFAITPVPPENARVALSEFACGYSLRVLIVHGNADSANALAGFVRQRGHDVRWTCDGASALEVAVAHEPQVVLLAIAMKGMDGYELAARLRRDARMKACFLIALKHSADAWGHGPGSQANIDLFLPMPIDYPVLETLLMWEGQRLHELRSPPKPD